MLRRGGPCARAGVLLAGLRRATGHGHAPSTTGRRLSSLRQTATNRGRYIGEPSDRLPSRLVRWTPRRRIAYLGWADRVRRSIVSLDTPSITAQAGGRPC